MAPTSPSNSTLAPPQLSQSVSPALVDPTLSSYRPPSPALEPIRKPGFEYHPTFDPRRSTNPYKPQPAQRRAMASSAAELKQPGPSSSSPAPNAAGVTKPEQNGLERLYQRPSLPHLSSDPDAANYLGAADATFVALLSPEEEALVDPDLIGAQVRPSLQETECDELDSEAEPEVDALGTTRNWDREDEVLAPTSSGQPATATPSMASKLKPCQNSSETSAERKYWQPSTESEEEALVQIALEQSQREQQEQDERDVQAAIAQSLGLPLPTYGDPEPEPKPKEFQYDASSLRRPTSEMMLNVVLDNAYYSRELEEFRAKWLVELCVKLQSQAQRKAPIGSAPGVTYKFGPHGTVVVHHSADTDKMNDDLPDTPAFRTLTADAQVLITYQALNDLVKSGVNCPTETKHQLLESRKLASNVLYTLTREFGPVLQYEPVEDAAVREFAIVADVKSTDPDEQFDKDVGLWLRTMGEKDVLFKRASEVMAKKRKLDDSRFCASLGDDEVDEMAIELSALKERFDNVLSAQALAEALAVEQSNRATEAERKLAKLATEREGTIKRLEDVVSGKADAGVALADLLRDLSLASAVDEVEAEAESFGSDLGIDGLDTNVDGEELDVDEYGERWSDSDEDMWPSPSQGV